MTDWRGALSELLQMVGKLGHFNCVSLLIEGDNYNYSDSWDFERINHMELQEFSTNNTGLMENF